MKKNKRLLWFNELLTNKWVVGGLCGCIVLLCLLASLTVMNLFENLGRLLQGESQLHYLTFHPQHWRVYLIAGGISLAVSALMVYKIRTNFKDLNVGQKGDAKLMTLQQIQDTYLEIDEKDKEFEGVGGLVVARSGKKLYIDNRVNNNFVVALSRGGKGELEVIPSIDIYSRAKEQSSLIVNDIKNGELSRACIPHLLKRGYDVRIINFETAEFSHGYNLLHIATKYYKEGDVGRATQALKKTAFSLFNDPNTKDPFWSNASITLFCAVAMAHIIDCVKQKKEERITLYSVALFISAMSATQGKEGSALDLFFKARDLHDPARLLYTTMSFAEGKTRSAVLSVAFSKLELFLTPTTATITSCHEIEIEKLGGFDTDKPMALFIRLPQNNSAYYPIASILFSQIHYALTNKANDQCNGKCPRPVKFIGDEIFNGAPLENLDSVLSTCLSANISYDFYAQSYAQVFSVYGKEKGQIILDNCSTKIYIMSDNEETRKEIASKVGVHTTKNVSRAGSRFSLSKSITESYEERPLISPKELFELQEGEIVTIQALKRQDLQGNPITSLPIVATGDLKLTYRYRYLPEFNTDTKLDYKAIGLKKKNTKILPPIYLPTEEKEVVSSTPSKPIHSAPSVQTVLNETKQNILFDIFREVGIEVDLSDYNPGEFLQFCKELFHDAELSKQQYTQIKHIIGGDPT